MDRTNEPTLWPWSACCPLLVAAACLAACSGGRSVADERALRASRTSGDISIAAVWPWERRADIRYGDGLNMALEEINASGGVKGRPLRLVRHDDHESVDEGIIIAQKIAADPEVMAVIGHLQSYITVPVAPTYDAAGLVLVAPTATDPDLTSGGREGVFRATFTDQETGRALAAHARPRFRRVAIQYIRNNYGRRIANAFEEQAGQMGIVVVARRSYDPNEEVGPHSFAGTLREWKLLGIDAIVLAGEVPSAAHFVVQARAEGIEVPIIGGDAMSSPALLKVAGAAAEGMVVTSFFHPDEPRPAVARWRAAFEKRFGVAPDAGAALGYDSVHLLAHAMRTAGTANPGAVAGALRSAPPFTGVTGEFRFGPNGAAIGRRIVKMRVRNGRFEHFADPAPESVVVPATASAR